jgi:hypothetical protein
MGIIITINVQLILKIREIIFLCGQITLWAISRDILRGQKVEVPSKFPEKWPIKYFAQKLNIIPI